MHSTNQFDGPSPFSGGGFIQPTQSTQAPDPPPKNHGPQCVVPLTIKQITQSYYEETGLIVDGVEANFRIVGMMMSKEERETDVTFVVDDGTGRIEISRWISAASDAVEMAAVQDGSYVRVSGRMKEFQGKKHAFAFSVQPVTDFNDIALHFIECIYVHQENTRQKGGIATHIRTNPSMTSAPFPNRVQGYQVPLPNQEYRVPPPNQEYQVPLSNHCLAYSGMDQSGNDIYKLVLGVFQESMVQNHEHGLHVDEVVRRLGLPKNKTMEAINYLADVGFIYSTIDDCHFQSASNC